MKQRTLFMMILLSCMLIFVACGDNEKSNQTKKEESKSDKQEKKSEEVSPSIIIDWETEDFSNSKHKEITISDARFPEHGHYPFAHKGMFMLSGNYTTDFYDYKEGKAPDYDLDGYGDPRLDTSKRVYQHNDGYFHFMETDNKSDENYLVEVNIHTGEKKQLKKMEHEFLTAKKDDILYIESDNQLTALDTKADKEIWNVEVDSSLTFYDMFLTESSVLLLSDEGLAVFTQKDGEKLYEAKGYYHDAVVDGEYFYVMAYNEDALFGADGDEWDILKFHESSEDEELLFTTPEVVDSYEYNDTYIDVLDDYLFIKVRYSVLTYDKNNGKLLSTISIYDDLVEDGLTGSLTSEELSYNLDTAFHNGYIYTRTSAYKAGEDVPTVAIVDPATGEMIENYQFENGESFGPIFDGENVVVLHWLKDEEDPKVYIFE